MIWLDTGPSMRVMAPPHTIVAETATTANATTPTCRKRNPKSTRHYSPDAPTALPAAACWHCAGADGGGGSGCGEGAGVELHHRGFGALGGHLGGR